jgi:hypothetical protein
VKSREIPIYQGSNAEFGILAASLVLIGIAIGGALLLFNAPLWIYYLAPIAGLPALIRILPALEASEDARKITPGSRLAPSNSGSESRAGQFEPEWRLRKELAAFRSEQVSAALRTAAITAMAIALLIGVITFGVHLIGSVSHPGHATVAHQTHHTETTTSGSETAESATSASSPVVPILIAVIVLAAVSIGVVLYRQRKVTRAQEKTRPHGRLL